MNKFKDEPRSDKPKPDQNMVKPSWYRVYIFLLLATLLGLFVSNAYKPKTTSWLEFRETMLLTQEVSHIEVINKETVEVYIKENKLNQEKYEGVAKTPFLKSSNPGPHYVFSIGSIDVFEQNIAEAQESLPATEWIDVRYDYRDNWFNSLWIWVLPIIMIVLFWNIMLRRGGGGLGGKNLFNFGSSTATIFDATNKSKVTFEDVAGLEEAKTEVIEIVDFLKTPENYTRLGGKIPKGVILVGPPGTGKTLLAKAVAGEAQVPFFSLSGSEFVEMFVGVGASRVRDLFKKAKEKAPSIIFIDEIDAIGRSRGKVQAIANQRRKRKYSESVVD